ncbi:hypothetical protein Sme01_02580 [Sphaerisporangium melleum]|uniref:Uncharacterized protein n=1 Tax=Sphaerisporangium melleum TaxID=321316 RepID=A0A917VBX2_9ACTN|nr:hypothetical protein [Sphaerisporangium melleum]GGK60990.1 hypothetical protein GCM10007964_00120 [Sphaerisporangium melleum]GII67782.1 hypothetical protein Sme01_02580 [Sphaerisporangium melleum]
MSRRDWRVFAVRCWEFRPSGGGVLGWTAVTLLLGWVTGLPTWVCVAAVAVLAGFTVAGSALLELWGEADPEVGES